MAVGAAKSGEELSLFQRPGSYHQNWYVLGHSEDFPVGTVKGLNFLGGRVVVWRGENGQVKVQSAYCAHLGADLSVGEVCGNVLQCEFHHWEYGQDGRCVNIPASKEIPERARIFSFPTEEKWGLVWAFNGEEALFDIPTFRDLNESMLVSRAKRHEGFPVEPWVLITNSHDFQHLRHLHGLRVVEGPNNIIEENYKLEHDVEFVTPDGHPLSVLVRVVGTNTTVLTMNMDGVVFGMMYTGTYTQHDGHTRFHFITVAPQPTDSPSDKAAAERALAIADEFGLGLVDEDAPVMATIRFNPKVLIEADEELNMFLNYVRRFPTADPLSDY